MRRQIAVFPQSTASKVMVLHHFVSNHLYYVPISKLLYNNFLYTTIVVPNDIETFRRSRDFLTIYSIASELFCIECS